jgi:hypothetical protein
MEREGEIEIERAREIRSEEDIIPIYYILLTPYKFTVW